MPPAVAPGPAPVPDARTARLQAALARLGLYEGLPDGIADAKTLRAVRAFQAASGDAPTGALTRSEIVKLLNNW